MPDMTLCKCYYNCKEKEYCYRFTATPSSYQSYADFSFGLTHKDEDGNCKYFYEMEERK